MAEGALHPHALSQAQHTFRHLHTRKELQADLPTVCFILFLHYALVKSSVAQRRQRTATQSRTAQALNNYRTFFLCIFDHVSDISGSCGSVGSGSPAAYTYLYQHNRVTSASLLTWPGL